jgi:hypothetical protein
MIRLQVLLVSICSDKGCGAETNALFFVIIVVFFKLHQREAGEIARRHGESTFPLSDSFTCCLAISPASLWYPPLSTSLYIKRRQYNIYSLLSIMSLHIKKSRSATNISVADLLFAPDRAIPLLLDNR